MKAASPALVALLASSDQFIMADLYTITLIGGSVLRYSAAPTALTVNSYTFALGPKFERSKTKGRHRCPSRPARGENLSPADRSHRRSALSRSRLAGAAGRGDPAARTKLHAKLRGYEPGNSDLVRRPSVRHRLHSYRPRHQLPLASRASEYSDAASALAVVLYPLVRRRNVPIRSVEPSDDFFSRTRLHAGANCDHGRSKSDESVRARDHKRR